MDLFDKKNISPMLLHSSDPFNNKDYIYEMKFDGIRCIAYLDNDKVVLKSRNNNDITKLFPELYYIYKCSKKRCILDGEIIVIKDNGPDFFLVIKRTLTKNNININNLSNMYPAYFIAFDILYYDDKELINIPLLKRKEYLHKYIKESNNLFLSKYIEKDGIKFFYEIKKKKLEGIVAKEKNSIYEIGRRTYSWLKIKAILEEDFYIAGFKQENNEVKSLVLVSKEKNNLIYHGDVNLPNQKDKLFIKKFSEHNQSKNYYFDKKDVVWLKIKLKCTVRYLQKTSNNHLRHPVFIKFVE